MEKIIQQNITQGIPLQDESVQCVVTSPPYWGLRDYGVDGQLGLEATPDEYVATMVKVFQDVRRVLRKDGTLWLNIGDSYAGSWKGGGDGIPGASWENMGNVPVGKCGGLKPKNMFGIPWRLALALQADGWWLRTDIIWSKPNPMPESTKDRPTRSHEYLFLLTKSARYYYDQESIREPVTGNAHHRGNGVNPKAKVVPSGWETGKGSHNKKMGRYKPRPKQNESFSESVNELVDTRNKRTVWTIPTQSFKGVHHATFPEKLVEPCVLAGSKIGDVVFDPFCGSGTVGVVARRFRRNFIGLELSAEYIEKATKRINDEHPQLPF